MRKTEVESKEVSTFLMFLISDLKTKGPKATFRGVSYGRTSNTLRPVGIYFFVIAPVR